MTTTGSSVTNSTKAVPAKSNLLATKKAPRKMLPVKDTGLKFDADSDSNSSSDDYGTGVENSGDDVDG